MAMSNPKGLGPRDLGPNPALSSWNISMAMSSNKGLGIHGHGPNPQIHILEYIHGDEEP